MRFVLVLCLAACSPQVYRDGTSVHVSGPIDQRSYTAVAPMIDVGTTLVLDSDGGLLAPAVGIARLVNKWGADTRVENECASACAVVFAAGRHRSLAPDARIGVHRSTGGTQTDEAMAGLMTVLGVPARTIHSMLDTPAGLVHWLSEEELHEWRVTR